MCYFHPILRLFRNAIILFITIQFLIINSEARANVCDPSTTEQSTNHNDLTSLIKGLKSAKATVRVSCACKLAKLGAVAEPAIAQLIALLNDSRTVPASECAMERWGIWRDDLVANSPAKQAAFTLIAIGEPAVEPLIEALKDENSTVRSFAALALGPLKDSRSIEPLILLLEDEEWWVREQAARSLGFIESKRIVPPLITALKDSEWQVREQAAWALGVKGDRRAIEPLVQALDDSEWQVRERATWALGLKGDRNIVKILIETLKDDSPMVRERAAWALGLKGDVRAVPHLNAILKDESTEVRQRALWALGLIMVRDPRVADEKVEIDVDAILQEADRADRHDNKKPPRKQSKK